MFPHKQIQPKPLKILAVMLWLLINIARRDETIPANKGQKQLPAKPICGSSDLQRSAETI